MPALFVPAGVSIFFVLPPILSAAAVVVPAVGDADLFLGVNIPFPAVVGSRNAGLIPDTVSFAFPFPFPFVPWFNVFGFLRSVTLFRMIGFGFP